ncbi:hypothetical protein [Cellulomonas sp. Y8]|uniref:hypothetical protein n=1 Tax=Cellulomonas sp. Y8 TaxID=2591145 RepID=UPI0011CA6766|nr:hypothetical protein [Cellulomonas sp. Y8]
MPRRVVRSSGTDGEGGEATVTNEDGDLLKEGFVPMEFRPVRLPRRALTAAQAEKFAALREEIETELASRAAARARLRGQGRDAERRRWKIR